MEGGLAGGLPLTSSGIEYVHGPTAKRRPDRLLRRWHTAAPIENIAPFADLRAALVVDPFGLENEVNPR